MVKGRPPKPTKVLELNGAFKKNPNRKRARAGEPKPKGNVSDAPMPPIAPPPEGESFPDSGQLLGAYQRILETAPDGVLTDSDSIFVSLLAQLLVKARGGFASASELSLLMTGLGKLGMTPSDRARLQLKAPEKPKNRWSNAG